MRRQRRDDGPGAIGLALTAILLVAIVAVFFWGAVSNRAGVTPNKPSLVDS